MLYYHGPVVAFDLDDTLFRERDFCRSGFEWLCNRDSYRVLDCNPYPDEDSLRRLEKQMDVEISNSRNPFVPFESFFKPLAENLNLEWNLKDHINSYRAHRPKVLRLTEGVENLLEELRRKGIRMALITDGRSTTQRRKIEALGLEKYFHKDLIFISEETGFDKNSKEAFAALVRIFPEAKSFYYIGDNPEKDFYYPNLMGWKTIQVPSHPDNVHLEAKPASPLHEPQHKVEDYISILQLV